MKGCPLILFCGTRNIAVAHMVVEWLGLTPRSAQPRGHQALPLARPYPPGGRPPPFRHLPGQGQPGQEHPREQRAHGYGPGPCGRLAHGAGVAMGRGVAVAMGAVGRPLKAAGEGVARGVGGTIVGRRRSAVGRPLPATVGEGRAVGVAVGEGRGAGVGVGPLIAGTTRVPNSMYFRPQASQASKRTGYSPGGANRSFEF